MRQAPVAAVATLLLLALGLPVGGSPPIGEVFDSVTMSCELSGTPGSGDLFIGLFTGPEGGEPFADSVIWLPGSDRDLDPPDLFSDFEGTVVEIDSDLVSATIPMVSTETGERDGVVTVQGAIGDPFGEETVSNRFRDGNRWVDVTEEIQFLEATAQVALDSVQFDASCGATRSHLEFRSTNPHGYRIDSGGAFLSCFSIGSDGSNLSLFTEEFDDDASLSIEVFAADGEEGIFGSTEIVDLSGEIDETIALFDLFDGSEQVSVAQIAMTVSEGGTTISDIVSQDQRVKETQTELLVSGVVEIDDVSYDLGDCFGSRFEARGIFNESEGPQMNGNPPGNDTPDGASALGSGDSDQIQTKAANLNPEMPCAFVVDGELVEEFPIGKTVWYTIQGTGAPITVSTSGSDFDTILGVYAGDGEAFEQIACVDDIFDGGFSLQAEITFDSVRGETYYLQAGGFGLFQDPEFPEISSLPEYGLLKISVSR